MLCALCSLNALSPQSGECEIFPKGAHDDLVDTVTQALWFLRKSGVALLSEERAGDVRERSRLPGERQSEPIYDV
jgi:hypothetical protein